MTLDQKSFRFGMRHPDAGRFRIHEPLGAGLVHAHDEDHLTIVLAGKARVMIGEDWRVLSAGEWVNVPAQMPHVVELGPDDRAICVFPRTDVKTRRVP